MRPAVAPDPFDALPLLDSAHTVLPVGTRVRIRGVARAIAPGVDPLVARASLQPKGLPPLSTAQGQAFLLQLADDASVEIERPEPGVPLVPETTQAGTWNDLRALPSAEGFDSRAPGPHVRATLGSAVLLAGQRIEVLGIISGRGSAREAGGPSSPVTRLRPLVISLTVDDEAPIRVGYDQSHRGPERLRLQQQSDAGLLLLKVLVAAAVLGALGLAVRAGATVEGIGFAAVALCVLTGVVALTTFVPTFRPSPSAEWGREGEWPFTLLGPGVLLCAGLGGGYLLVISGPTSAETVLCVFGLLALAVPLLPIYWRVSARAARIVSMILGTPEHPQGLPTGAWGLSVGRVELLSPDQGGARERADRVLGIRTTVTGSLGRGSLNIATKVGAARFDTQDYRSVVESVERFAVGTAGGRLRVETGGALWTSSVAPDVKCKSLWDSESILVGCEVAVVGRIAARGPGEPPSTRATGPESLILFGVGPEQRPLEVLGGHRATIARYRLYAGMISGVAGLLLIALAVLVMR